MNTGFPHESKKSLEKRYLQYTLQFNDVLDKFTHLISNAFSSKGLSVTIRHRVKNFESWYAKLLRQATASGGSFEAGTITDILGIRIICPYLEDVELTSNLLQEMYKVIELETKGSDYPSNHFGYESVHFLLRIPEEIFSDALTSSDFLPSPVCEVQVRTILQEAWAEVDHELNYKSSFSPLDEPLKRKLSALNATLTLSDIMFQEIRDYQRTFHKALKQRRKTFYKSIHQEYNEGAADFPAVEKTNDLSDNHLQKTIDSLLLQGLLAHNKENFAEAVNIYTGILSSNISEEIKKLILIHRGMAYFSSGFNQLALEDFNHVLRIDPENTKARYYRAVHFRNLKNYEKAFKDLEECISLEPLNLEYLTAKAETQEESGDIKEALAGCSYILRIDHNFKPALRLMERLKGKPL